MEHVDTVCDEAKAFMARHPDLSQTAQATGGLIWGLLRALAQCPDCGPGVYRWSPDQWHTLLCPQCGGVWIHQDTLVAEVVKKTRARRTRS